MSKRGNDTDQHTPDERTTDEPDENGKDQGTIERSTDQHPPRSDPEAVVPLGAPLEDRNTM